jgi:hypothetical protein
VKEKGLAHTKLSESAACGEKQSPLFDNDALEKVLFVETVPGMPANMSITKPPVFWFANANCSRPNGILLCNQASSSCLSIIMSLCWHCSYASLTQLCSKSRAVYCHLDFLSF